MSSPHVASAPSPGASTGVPGADHEALELGHIRTARVRKPPRAPSWALKVVMAVTGTIFALFVFVHMIGNLKVFTGAESFNEYAYWLRTVLQPFLPYEGLLWILRVVLLACLVAHVAAAAAIWVRGRASRGPHRRRGMWLRSFTTRSMLVTGILLLAFVVIHVLDLTTGTPGVATEAFRPATGPQDTYAYENLVVSLQRPVMAGVYILAMLALFLHLAHGLWTVVTDLGGTGRRLREVAYLVAGGVALAVTLGNIIIPILVLLGVLS